MPIAFGRYRPRAIFANSKIAKRSKYPSSSQMKILLVYENIWKYPQTMLSPFQKSMGSTSSYSVSLFSYPPVSSCHMCKSNILQFAQILEEKDNFHKSKAPKARSRRAFAISPVTQGFRHTAEIWPLQVSRWSERVEYLESPSISGSFRGASYTAGRWVALGFILTRFALLSDAMQPCVARRKCRHPKSCRGCELSLVEIRAILIDCCIFDGWNQWARSAFCSFFSTSVTDFQKGTQMLTRKHMHIHGVLMLNTYKTHRISHIYISSFLPRKHSELITIAHQDAETLLKPSFARFSDFPRSELRQSVPLSQIAARALKLRLCQTEKKSSRLD
jgi:hypothetical protein